MEADKLFANNLEDVKHSKHEDEIPSDSNLDIFDKWVCTKKKFLQQS